MAFLIAKDNRYSGGAHFELAFKTGILSVSLILYKLLVKIALQLKN